MHDFVVGKGILKGTMCCYVCTYISNNTKKPLVEPHINDTLLVDMIQYEPPHMCTHIIFTICFLINLQHCQICVVKH